MKVVNHRWRKIVCVALGAVLFALCSSTDAQQPGKFYRIGYLSAGIGMEFREKAFRERLGELGYVEGKNLFIDWRFTKGDTSLFPRIAAELVRLKLDCIVAFGVAAISALKDSTNTIPIVIGTIDADPVELGWVASLARPSGNITGITGIAYDIAGKRLELLKETVPKASRVALLVTNPTGAVAQAHLRETEVAARTLKLHLQILAVRAPEALENAFRDAREARLDAISLVATGFTNSHRPRIVSLAAESRLPVVYSNLTFVLDGGLMSYASDVVAQSHRAAIFVDKILKGAKAGELPLEQPRKFELAINLKTAKQIGLTVPQRVLLKADRVIK